MTLFKAAIYDLDGVIADTAISHYTAWKRLADRLGVPFDKKINERLKGVPRMESLDIILENSTDHFSFSDKEELASEKNAYYTELISNVTPDDLLPGVRDAIETAKRIGLKTALASASKNVHTLIENLEIADLLDFVADANFIKNHKPHPEIFQKAAEGVGVPTNLCIGFEDAIAGIQAIRRAGMYAVGIGDSETLNEADIVFPSLAEFSFEKINAAA